MRRCAFALLFLAGLPACAPFPEIDALGPDTAPPPQLEPIDKLLAEAEAFGENPGPALAGQAARLKARAAALKAAAPPP